MEELFKHLEFRIQKLLQKFNQVKMSNRHIQQGKRSLTFENERLLTKQKSAITKIENMVVRLKPLEEL